jgi:hypothetical protein
VYPIGYWGGVSIERFGHFSRGKSKGLSTMYNKVNVLVEI